MHSLRIPSMLAGREPFTPIRVVAEEGSDRRRCPWLLPLTRGQPGTKPWESE